MFALNNRATNFFALDLRPYECDNNVFKLSLFHKVTRRVVIND